jgi:hypothetical protein
VKLLTGAVQSRACDLTEEEARAIADLWIRLEHLLKQDVEGQLWAALVLAWNIEELQEDTERLDPRLRIVHADSQRIVDAAGLSAHPGWRPPELEVPPFDLGEEPVSSHPVCTARSIQWAVGQGGFWTTSGTHRAEYSQAIRPFEIVFDCGSSTAGVLSTALLEYKPA